MLTVALLCGLLRTFSMGEEESVSFVDDVLPVLGKAGCSSSGCHSKPAGQNGFKLSVFAYDPKADYQEIVFDGRGRRLSLGAPEQSLILQKATQAVPHEGGKRFDRESTSFQVISRWIENGMPYEVASDSVLEQLAIVPKDFLTKPGYEKELTVMAYYGNGRQRDVTALASFKTNKEVLVEVTESGVISVSKERTGEAVISAQFMGEVATTRVTIPAAAQISEERFAALPKHNYIDALAYQRLQNLGVFPSPRCLDGEFLRRVSIDLIGRLPSAVEAREFLANSNPNKRSELIESLLQHPGYADHWAVKWADLFRPNPDRAGVKSVYILDQWLREAFRENMSMDVFARKILAAQGSTHRLGPAVIYRDRRTPEDLTTLFSQVFLGVRLECARCHHHPNEKWSQEDFYQMAAFFGSLKHKGDGVSPPISGGWEMIYHRPGGKVIHPVTQKVMLPKPPDGVLASFPKEADPRGWFVDWLVAPDNPFFAKAMVNRLWAEVMGRGIVHPVDDFRVTNPATNPLLLDALAEDFIEHGYDVKHLLRRITNSALYQQSSLANASNGSDGENFARSYRRRLAAEVLTDALADITGLPDDFDGLPGHSRANQVWNFKIASNTMDAFGRPDSSSDCPCERNLSTSVVQALHMMHSQKLQDKLDHKDGRLSQLVGSDRSRADIVEELYLLTYSRLPEPRELAIATAAFEAPDATRQTACEDLLWALLNSAEFVFNH